MDKRYQVFISSTFEDLLQERQAVLRAVLELDHMPAGMELFPAVDDDAWNLITDVIDRSDYYVVVVGGRYGSLDEAGIGYTEKEYDYALEAGKPVIPLLHASPESLPRERTETDEDAWALLQDFRAKIEDNHTCVYWDGPDDLKAKVIVGLTASVKRRPGVGWVRADEIPEYATPEAVLKLQNRIEELEGELASDRTSPPPGTEDLSQGEETYEVPTTVRIRPPHAKSYESDAYSFTIHPSWNELFAAIAPTLINEAKDSEVRKALRSGIGKEVGSSWRRMEDKPDGKMTNWNVSNSEIDTILVQFRALGLIRESTRKRSVKDTATYWTLTPYGDHMLTQLRAVRREEDGVGESSESDVP